MASDCDRCTACRIDQSLGAAVGSRCPLLPRAFRTGSLVYREGARAERVFYVAEGAIRLTRASGDTPDRVVRADVLGIEALTGGSYAETARAQERSLLCSAPREAFEEWLKPEDRPIRAALREAMATRIGRCP